MTETDPGIGHNTSAERLRQIVSRHERLAEEIKALQSDQKDLMQEAASAGFDKKALRAVLKLRKMEPSDREEMEHLIATYLRALGE